MKILHVINRCSVANGAAMVMKSIIEPLIKKGHEVDVLALVDVTPSCGDMFEQLGCKYSYIMPEGKTLYSPSLLLKLSKQMRKYDVVHAHLFPSFYWVALVKFFCGYKGKLVFTEHSTQNNRQKSYLRTLERFIYKQYDEIVAISDAVESSLSQHLNGDFDIKVIHNGLDVDFYSHHAPISREEIGVPSDAVMLTQVARFGPEKDQMTVLRALELLPDNYHVVFVGAGPLFERHKEIAQSMNLQRRTHFLGIRRDVAAILQASDIVLAISHFEGFGLTAVEGMASCKPVIASDVPGLRDVVSGAGLLCKPNDPSELARMITDIVSDKEVYSQIVIKGIDRAKVYSCHKMAEKYEAIYINRA